jgi:aquaporin Z
VKSYVTEVIGTFFLVFTIGMTAVHPTPFAPIAIGSALMIMVYMGGHISGAHYNPAVSISLAMRGALEWRELIPYLVAQVVGALLAAVAVYAITGGTFAPAPGAEAGVMAVLLSEVLFTFALVLVIMNVATHPATEGNSYYGFAIGFTVATGAFAVGGVSGGAFNPAVGIGPIAIDTFVAGGSMGALWYYLVGPILGGALAVPVFRMQLDSAG